MHIYEDGFLVLLDEFLDRLAPSKLSSDKISKAFDISREFILFNFDSMGEFCFGQKFSSMRTPKNAEIIEKTHRESKGLNAVRRLYSNPKVYKLTHMRRKSDTCLDSHS